MFKFIFGPVSSRRFGLSLGVDLSPDIKQCNFDCLYCELKGAKTVDTMQNPPSVKEITDELKTALKKYPDIDVITVTANGEPTLYPYLKELAREINGLKCDKKLLILSNGALITDKSVQEALLEFDIVKLSLDAATPQLFKKLDRAHKSVDLERMIEGMKEFSGVFKNELVLETLVVKDLNDTRDDFLALNRVINEIKPSRIDLGTIDRPSAYRVLPVSFETLEILSREIENVPLVIVKRKAIVSPKEFSLDEIIQLLRRRPQSAEDIEAFFDKESKERLKKLLDEGRAETVSVAGVVFYKILQ
ncbi:MAG: radical SAM protein [Campylobacteraceae bacterium]|jgi:wyosine [tRNA(Phe)-imidazoG37] synthetase (radical SAM superfamily)|nr:radical SAM protein [Campylobacteraceae bacterium]